MGLSKETYFLHSVSVGRHLHAASRAGKVRLNVVALIGKALSLEAEHAIGFAVFLAALDRQLQVTLSLQNNGTATSNWTPHYKTC